MKLLNKDIRNEDVLFPYLSGEDLNSRADQSPSRWIINFRDLWLDRAETYADCLEIVRDKVKPERDRLGLKSDASAKGYAKLWWQYARGLELYNTISNMQRVLAVAFTSRTCAFSFIPTGITYSIAVVVVALDKNCYLATLQST